VGTRSEEFSGAFVQGNMREKLSGVENVRDKTSGWNASITSLYVWRLLLFASPWLTHTHTHTHTAFTAYGISSAG